MSDERQLSSMHELKQTISLAFEDCERKRAAIKIENEMLMNQIANKDNRIKELETIIQQKAIFNPLHIEKELLQENLMLKAQQEGMQKKIELLTMQLTVYKDDFDLERNDRERAHSRVVELENKVESFMKWYTELPISLKNQPLPTSPFPPLSSSPSTPTPSQTKINTTQSSAPIHPTPQRTTHNHPSNANFNPSFNPTNPTNNPFRRQGFAADGNQKRHDSSSFETLDSSQPKKMVDFDDFTFVNLVPLDARRTKEESLRCPSCLLKFSARDHMKLVDHMETCRMTYR